MKLKTKLINTQLVKDVNSAIKKEQKRVKKTQVPVDQVCVYCTACTKHFFARTKLKGELIKQQLCPHIIFKQVIYK